MKTDRQAERPSKPRLPKGGEDRTLDDEKVDEASKESFPASDPPANSPTVGSQVRPERPKPGSSKRRP